jgi:rare lipoprotein A
LLAACGGHKQAHVSVPPPVQTSSAPPDANQEDADSAEQTTSQTKPSAGKKTQTAPSGSTPRVSHTEVGLASWYGPPYNHRKGSNGQIYDMNAMTAAHRTLPLGTVVRVTNLQAGKSAVVTITDRGPFIEGRIIDLSLAAAKAIDVWRSGTAKVKLEVLRSPASLSSGGRWAVQIGGFHEEHSADKEVHHLEQRYQSAKVISFASPAGDYWVRVRVPNDDRRQAEEIARNSRTSEGSVFLVRLD